MKLLETIKEEAIGRGLLVANREVDAATAFRLVRDMPYKRATDRQPETIIKEWQGTCSGKHYLLKALFAELGIQSRVMACTTENTLTKEKMPEVMHGLIEQSEGHFVDVHNYLILELPEGEMIVDATWPLATKAAGLRVNGEFVLGQDQQIADDPIQNWVVPEGIDPQDFKDKLLAEQFSEEELHYRDLFIKMISELLGQL
jgi:hypothetical protein